jgi:hypothetical protein
LLFLVLTNAGTFKKSFSSRAPPARLNQQTILSQQIFCIPKKSIAKKGCLLSSCADMNCKPRPIKKSDEYYLKENSEGSDTSSEADHGESSSIEDLEDAFKEDVRISGNSTGANKKLKTDDYCAKEERQKGDASSLKNYAQSKISFILFHKIQID